MPGTNKPRDVIEQEVLAQVHEKYIDPVLSARIETAKNNIRANSGLKPGTATIGRHIMRVYKDGSIVYHLNANTDDGAR